VGFSEWLCNHQLLIQKRLGHILDQHPLIRLPKHFSNYQAASWSLPNQGGSILTGLSLFGWQQNGIAN